MEKRVIILSIIALFFLISIAIIFASNKEKSSKPALEKIVFIHYKKGFGKTASTSKTSTCYKFLKPGAKPIKWNILPINYIINPKNPQNLSESFIASAIYKAAETWDANTSKELFNDSYTIDYTLVPGVQDYKNTIGFGNYSEPGVIAVTTVWYNSATSSIVEFDIMFDIDWIWGDADPNNDGKVDNPNVMDLQNIATHEFGHGIGLDDVYNSECSEVTMYGYSDYGEIKKRTLEQPDVTGLQKLYGA